MPCQAQLAEFGGSQEEPAIASTRVKSASRGEVSTEINLVHSSADVARGWEVPEGPRTNGGLVVEAAGIEPASDRLKYLNLLVFLSWEMFLQCSSSSDPSLSRRQQPPRPEISCPPDNASG